VKANTFSLGMNSLPVWRGRYSWIPHRDGKPMKPIKGNAGPAGAKGRGGPTKTFAPPTPKVTRQKRAKVLSAAERAAFLAPRPDLKPK